MMGIFYIYLNQRNKLVYKFTHYDNGLQVGDINYYGHILIYKGYYSNYKNKLIDLFSQQDYMRI